IYRSVGEERVVRFLRVDSESSSSAGMRLERLAPQAALRAGASGVVVCDAQLDSTVVRVCGQCPSATSGSWRPHRWQATSSVVTEGRPGPEGALKCQDPIYCAALRAR